MSVRTDPLDMIVIATLAKASGYRRYLLDDSFDVEKIVSLAPETASSLGYKNPVMCRGKSVEIADSSIRRRLEKLSSKKLFGFQAVEIIDNKERIVGKQNRYEYRLTEFGNLIADEISASPYGIEMEAILNGHIIKDEVCALYQSSILYLIEINKKNADWEVGKCSYALSEKISNNISENYNIKYRINRNELVSLLEFLCKANSYRKPLFYKTSQDNGGSSDDYRGRHAIRTNLYTPYPRKVEVYMPYRNEVFHTLKWRRKFDINTLYRVIKLASKIKI